MSWKTLICDDLVDTLFELQKYNEGVVVVCNTCKRTFKTKKTLETHATKFRHHI